MKKFMWSNLPVFFLLRESLLDCLRKSLYGLKQSPRAWFGKFSNIVQQFGMTCSKTDHSFFLSSLKCWLYLYCSICWWHCSYRQWSPCKHFQTKDLEKLIYFLGIVVAQSNIGIVISQRKYALDVLEEIGLMNSNFVDTHMDPNVKLLSNQGESLSDSKKYRRLVGKLNYLTVTHLDITFVVSVVSQFLNSPCEDHWNGVIHILKYH